MRRLTASARRSPLPLRGRVRVGDSRPALWGRGGMGGSLPTRGEEVLLTRNSTLSAVNRLAEIVRQTRETDIRLTLDLDGQGRAEVSTGIGFLDHMLELFARHS